MTTRYPGKCARCGANEYITKDHIIPKVMLKIFCVPEMNRACYIQPLCRDCNKLKSHALDPKNPRTIPLLRQLVDRYEEMYVTKVSRRKYVFKTLSVKSLTPATYHFGPCDDICQLELIYKKQKALCNART